MRPKIVTITGPSCSGKTTLVEELCRTGYFCKVVSFTSRQRRAGEVEGSDYYFKTAEECQDLIVSGRVQEYTKFKGEYYGREKQEVSKAIFSDKIPVLVLDPEGLNYIRNQYDEEVYSIYLNLPLDKLLERFLIRFNEYGTASDLSHIQYHAKRLHGLLDERNWLLICEHEKLINDFTKDNKDAIIQSLITEIIRK